MRSRPALSRPFCDRAQPDDKLRACVYRKPGQTRVFVATRAASPEISP